MKRHASFNRIYRVIWSKTRRAFVVVSEIANGHRKSHGQTGPNLKRPAQPQCESPPSREHILRHGIGLVLGISLASASAGAFAAPGLDELPTGGQITQGTGSISQSGNTLNVQQQSGKMIGQWQTFNIGQNATVNFQQPDASSVALNRIQDQNPSQIHGQLNANGQVYLLNPNGIVIGKTAQVNVGGIVASTQQLSDQDFLAGKNRFTANTGSNDGGIVNQGEINAQGGIVAFIAPQVSNEGRISNPGGEVVMAAGEQVSLDFDGDGLISVKVDKAAIDALAANKGLIQANGGAVIMTAHSANAILNQVVNNEGLIQAQSLVEHQGRIILDGGDQGVTRIAGTLDSSAPEGQGGQIVATGDNVLIDENARLTASGKTGGGEVLVGGNWQGSGGMRQATTVTMVESASIDASATESGDGGRIILEASDRISHTGTINADAAANNNGNGGTVTLIASLANQDSRTEVGGSISARGGDLGGDGGFIETSASRLNIADPVRIDTQAPMGKTGQWLIDPVDITIDAVEGNVTGSAIATALQSTNVTLDTSGTGTCTGITCSGLAGTNGDITINDNISVAGGSADTTLTLKANRSIVFNSDKSITRSGSYKLNTVLWADSDADAGGGYIGLLNGSSITTNGGHLWLGGGSGSITWNSLTVGNGYAAGTSAQTNGIFLGGAGVGDTATTTISTGGGNIAMYGKAGNFDGAGGDGSGTRNGIFFSKNNNVTIDSGVGTIYLEGDARGLSSGVAIGIQLNKVSAGTTLTSAATSGDAITLIGYGGSGGGNSNGLQFQHGALSATGGGNILLQGTEETPGIWWGGIQFNNGTIAAGTGNLILKADTIYESLGATLSGTGQLNIQPVTAGKTISIAGAAGTKTGPLSLPASYFSGGSAKFTNGFSGITVGNSNAGTITVGGAVTYNDPLTLKTAGNIVVNASTELTGTAAGADGIKSSLVLWADADSSGDGGITLNNGTTITTNGGGLWLGGSYGTNGSGTSSWTPYSGATAMTVGDGYAVSTGGNYGVLIDRATLSTDGGNINIYGQFNDAGTASDSGLYVKGSTLGSSGGNISLEGVNARISQSSDKATGLEIDGYNSGTGTSISSGAGNISLLGRLDASGVFYQAVGLNLGSKFLLSTGAGATGDVSITSTTGSISLEGDARNANSNNTWMHGLVLEVQEAGDDLLIQSGSGDITLTGRAGGGSSVSSAHGLSLQAKTTTSTIKVTSTGNGNITLDGDTDASEASSSHASLSLYGQTNAGNGTIWLGYNGSDAYSGAVTLRADSFTFTNNNWVGGDTGLGSVNILGTGPFELTSNASSFAREVALNNVFDFGTGLTGFTVGKSTNTANLNLNNQIVTAGTIAAYGGNITLSAELATSDAATGDISITTSGLSGSGAVSLADGRALTITQSGNSTYSGAISGTNASLTKRGAGALTLSGNSAYNGDTNIEAGTLGLTGGLSTATDVVMTGTSIWDLRAGQTIASLSMAAGNSITNSSSATHSSSLTVSGASTLANSVTTSGTQTYTGAVTLLADTTLTTTRSDITFGSTVDSADADNPRNLTATVLPGTTYYWVDWTDWNPATNTATGTITIGADVITVIYTNPQGIAFAQTSSGADYWTGFIGGAFVGGSPYVSANVANGPTGVDLIALQYAGSQTLAFSQPVENLAFSVVSLNGNGYGFNQDFNIESYTGYNSAGSGYFGSGTFTKTTAGSTYNLNGASGEPHGTIRFTGAFDQLTWSSLSNENWNGFTVGVSGSSAGAGTVHFNGLAGGSARLGAVSVNAGMQTAADITAAGSLSVSGLADLGGDVTTTGNQSFASPVTLSSDVALTTTINGNVSAAKTIDGAHELTVHTNGTGDTTLGGAVGGKTALSGVTVNTDVLNAGAIALAANASLDITHGGASAITGGISGSGATLTKAGDGMLTLSGTNTYTGATRIDGGGLTIRHDAPTLTTSGYSGSGTLAIEPVSASFSSAFTFDKSVDSNLAALTLGKQGNTANITLGSATTIAGPAAIHAGAITLNAGLTVTGDNTLTLNSSGNATDGSSGFVSASNLVLTGSGNVTLDSASNAVGTLAASGVGALLYVDGDGLIIAGDNPAGINASGPVSISTLSGDLTVGANIATTDTSTSAIVLNAGKTAAAGTATGGNILISGSPTLSTGADGRALLYTGSVSGSTGVTSLVGSGSGRFRYNSDEAASNFTTALNSGLYAIYREHLLLNVSPSAQSMTYGGTTPTFTASYSGYANGDTSPGSVSGTASWTIAGSKSSSNNYVVGIHDVSYASGLTSNLGYGFSNNGSSTDELTVGKLALSGTAIAGVTTTYGTAADPGAVSFTNIVSGDSVTATAGIVSPATSTGGQLKAGSYVQSASSTLAGDDAGNYSFAGFTTGTANYTVGKLALTGSITAGSSIYGATLVPGNVSFNNLISSDLLGAATIAIDTNGNTSISGHLNSGSYTGIQSISSLSGADAGNYSFAGISGDYSISRANAIVSGNSSSLTYNGLARSVSGYSVSGLIAGETSAVLTSINASGAIGTNVGNYTNTVSGNALDGNYSLTFNHGSLVINQAPLTIRANNASKTCNGLPFSGGNGVSYQGFVNGETPVVLNGTLVYGGSSQGAVTTGTYAITPSGLSALNYTLSFIDGSLTITGNPGQSAFDSSLASTVSSQQGTTGTASNNQNSPSENPAGPSTGSQTILLAQTDNLVTDVTMALQVSAVSLTTNTHTEGLNFNQDSNGLSLYLPFSSTGKSNTPDLTQDLPVFEISQGALNKTGLLRLQNAQNRLSVSFRKTGDEQAAPLPRQWEAPQTTAKLTEASGNQIDFSVSVTGDGLLIIDLPKDSNVDRQQWVLLGLTTAKANLGTPVSTIKGVAFR